MAKVGFHGDTRLIAINEGDFGHDLDAKIDLYSDWKEWVLTDDNSKYAPAFRTIGGDPLGGVLSAGAYFFLQNQDGWRIRPHEDDHQLRITGNLYAEDPDQAMFVPSLGGYTITIALERSSLTQVVSVDGGTGVAPTAEEIADVVLEELVAGHYGVAGSLAEYLLAIRAKTEALPSGIKRGQELHDFKFVMLDAQDGRTPKTGLTVTAQRLIDNGAWEMAENAPSEKSYGAYIIDFEHDDLDGEVIMFRFTAPGADPRLITIVTVP